MNIIFIYLTLNMKIGKESMQIFTLFSQFHDLSHFFPLRMLD